MPQDGSRSRTARDRRRRLYRCRANPLAKESTSSQPSTSRKCNALARSAHSHDEGARDSRGFGGRSAIIFATAAVSRSNDPIGTAQNAVERIIDIDSARLLQSALFTDHSRQGVQYARRDHRGAATPRTRSGPRPPRAVRPRSLNRGNVAKRSVSRRHVRGRSSGGVAGPR